MVKFVRIVLAAITCSLVLMLLLLFMGVIKGNENIENNNGIDTKVIITSDGDIGVGVGDENYGIVITTAEYGTSM